MLNEKQMRMQKKKCDQRICFFHFFSLFFTFLKVANVCLYNFRYEGPTNCGGGDVKKISTNDCTPHRSLHTRAGQVSGVRAGARRRARGEWEIWTEQARAARPQPPTNLRGPDRWKRGRRAESDLQHFRAARTPGPPTHVHVAALWRWRPSYWRCGRLGKDRRRVTDTFGACDKWGVASPIYTRATRAAAPRVQRLVVPFSGRVSSGV